MRRLSWARLHREDDGAGKLTQTDFVMTTSSKVINGIRSQVTANMEQFKMVETNRFD
jgi:hypothetical protein